MMMVNRAIFGWSRIDADTYNDALKNLKAALQILNSHLKDKTYLVGNNITAADVVVAINLILPYQTVLDAGFRKGMANVSTWFEKTIKNPHFVKRLGNVKLAAKPFKPELPAKEEKKAEAKPAAKPKATEEGDEPAPKKEADPLDTLPPTSFDLYNFKTLFVNSKDRRGEGMKFFFDNYDKNGYSIYFLHYQKYEGEGVVLYQTANLLNGFLQRIDHFRKHAFAMHCLLGEEPNLEIEGVWMFRGKGIPQQMKEHPQFEYYSVKELDVDKEEDRKLITDFWSAKQGETLNGMKVQEAKLHK